MCLRTQKVHVLITKNTSILKAKSVYLNHFSLEFAENRHLPFRSSIYNNFEGPISLIPANVGIKDAQKTPLRSFQSIYPNSRFTLRHTNKQIFAETKKKKHTFKNEQNIRRLRLISTNPLSIFLRIVSLDCTRVKQNRGSMHPLLHCKMENAHSLEVYHV
jgi:hypothetical protein